MPGRIVEIAEDNRYIHVDRGFMVVKSTLPDREELGRIPLDDILALITHAQGLSYSNNLLLAFAERNVPFVLCAQNHSPVGYLLSVSGHHAQGKRFDAQIAASKPRNKQLWSQIVRSKIGFQSAVLHKLGLNNKPVHSLIIKVSSGDKQNIEAQAARRYWQLLFGSSFRRDRERVDENKLLNYGYTVFRAATARAVLSAGLHPTLGIHHSNQSNAMRLVDDLIEPFRPIIDITVKRIEAPSENEMSSEVKKQLVHSLYTDMVTSEGITPVVVCMQRLATSLAQVYLGEREMLDLPLSLAN